MSSVLDPGLENRCLGVDMNVAAVMLNAALNRDVGGDGWISDT